MNPSAAASKFFPVRMRNCMKWSYLGESFEVCDFTAFFRVHRHGTATSTAAVHDVHPSDHWTTVVKDGSEVFTFAARSGSSIRVVAPAAVGAIFRRWLDGLTAIEA